MSMVAISVETHESGHTKAATPSICVAALVLEPDHLTLLIHLGLTPLGN